MVARAVARVPRMVAKVLHAVARCVAMWLLGYYGWLLGCCYVVARVIRQC